MRLGRILIPGYVVDLDNEEMVDAAKDALWEDMWQASYRGEIMNNIKIEKQPPELKEEDIPEFLKGEENAEE